MPEPKFKSPPPDAIKERRAAAGLTQTQAAGLIHASTRAWQAYEAGERKLHPGLWALFKIRTPIGL
jgi:DNA-binding XRE family transcriptional regulator